MLCAPRSKAIERTLGLSAVPVIAIAAFARELIHVVADGFIAVSEDGAVRFNLVVARPDGSIARRRNQLPPLWCALPFLTVDRGFAQPCDAGPNGALLGCCWIWQVHQQQQNLRALAGAFSRQLVIPRGNRLEGKRIVLL